MNSTLILFFFFFFNDTATTEIYTLSLHDALPIFQGSSAPPARLRDGSGTMSDSSYSSTAPKPLQAGRSEEHTSELQSQSNIVCRLLLEKKKKKKKNQIKSNIENVKLLVRACGTSL